MTPLGHELEQFWTRLMAGERAISRIERFDPTGLRNEKAGEVKNWRFASGRFPLPEPPSLATQFALHAASDALADARLPHRLSRFVAGAVLATNFGGADAWEEYAAAFLDGDPRPEPFARFLFSEACSAFRTSFGLSGPVRLVSMACSSGTIAVGLAADMVRAGICDIALAGGHDCLALTPLAGLSALRTITADDIKPFSADRSGTLFGEGAGYVVVEEADHAQRRRARVYAEILGWWENNNGYHLTAPDPDAEGMATVIKRCLAAAGIEPGRVGYINAHGTGTEYHDPAETSAIKQVLGEHAYDVPVSSIKGAVGHLMGAAGAVETIATAMAVWRGQVPPTANHTLPDSACDLDYVPGRGRSAQIDVALCISAGIGGNNACLALGRVG